MEISCLITQPTILSVQYALSSVNVFNFPGSWFQVQIVHQNLSQLLKKRSDQLEVKKYFPLCQFNCHMCESNPHFNSTNTEEQLWQKSCHSFPPLGSVKAVGSSHKVQF